VADAVVEITDGDAPTVVLSELETLPAPAGPGTGERRRSVRTYRAGPAGRVRIGITGRRLRLVRVMPAPGWTWKVTEEEDDEIEVSFFRGAEEIEFEIEVENGRLRTEVDRED
jgi:hypothetical protein